MNLQEFLENSGCEKNLQTLFVAGIAPAVKRIRAAIEHQHAEKAGSTNVSGEQQLALDVQANEIVIDALKETRLVSLLASEEMEGTFDVPKTYYNPSLSAGHRLEQTHYSVAFDPLDGSSLVDVNFAVGSIFGVYPSGEFIGRSGGDQVAACYAVYGPHTTLVLTVKSGVHEFRLNNQDGEFYLTKKDLKVAPQARHFAPGNLRAAAERKDYLELTNQFIKGGLTLRYSGGMVPDVNHILLKGDGIFTYPGYSKAPEGKLRILFECAPMALLIEQAGGAANDGAGRLLEKKISELHQRTPIFLGSRDAVEGALHAL